MVSTSTRNGHELDSRRMVWNTTDGTPPIKFHGRGYYGVDEKVYSPAQDLPSSVKERLLISPFQTESELRQRSRREHRNRPRTASPSPTRHSKPHAQRPKSSAPRTRTSHSKTAWGKVTGLKISAMVNNSVDVMWNPPKGVDVLYYVVSVRQEDESGENELETNGSEPSIKLNDLEESVGYYVRVKTVSEVRTGPWSDEIRIFGYSNVPEHRPQAPVPDNGDEDEPPAEGQYLKDDDFYKDES